jgi:adenylosuccinate synthase
MQSTQATIVTDLGFGDAGKGTTIDYLARKGKVSAVVRFNGGAQAAHNVITPDGRHHTFRQFGSGSFVPGVKTHLSRFSLLDPVHLAYEALQLDGLGVNRPLSRISVHEDALVVTPFHKAANRFREVLRGDSQHGSCGMGIGETMSDSLTHSDNVRAKDLEDSETLSRKLLQIQERKREEFKNLFTFGKSEARLLESVSELSSTSFARRFAEDTVRFSQSIARVSTEELHALSRQGNLLFEGAQGVLLDEWRGFHPHTTWSTTTTSNADTLLEEIGYSGKVSRLGVLRAYHVRHGAGPFPTEDVQLSTLLPEAHNESVGWQGRFRAGWFDAVLARYALSVSGKIDSLVVTHLDTFSSVNDRNVCVSYRTSDMGRDSVLANLPVNPRKEDLVEQEKLTQLLSRVLPVYASAPKDEDGYLNMIEELLAVPVSLTSHGPKATDKRER